jgi:peptide/nickel transport system substrate-binding protein
VQRVSLTWRAAALATILALLAGACQAESSSPSAGESTAPEASGAPAESTAPQESTGIPQGGNLSIGFNSEIQWLDPSQGYDVVSWPAERLIFETLLGYDTGTQIVPLLADGMPAVSADGTVYTFKLHDNVNFVKADGSVLRLMTADDVAYSQT